MARKHFFEPGDLVKSFTGQSGIVVSGAAYLKIKTRLKEGRRPGHFFAPGCCAHPDYVSQVPVLFEDGTYDVMRALNIKKVPDLPRANKDRLQKLMAEHGD